MAWADVGAFVVVVSITAVAAVGLAWLINYESLGRSTPTYDDPAAKDRIWQIARLGVRDDSSHGAVSVIRMIHGGNRSSITENDLKLLKEDRRRALAAYPDKTIDELTEGVWLQADLSQHIPEKWGGGNSSGTMENGVWYLDGPFYEDVVKPEFEKRATAEETERYFTDRDAKRSAQKLARTEISWWMGGSGGSLSVDCRDGTCVIEQAPEWSSKAKRYIFPFTSAEWVDDPSDMEGFAKLPSFKDAKVEEIDIEPSGTSTTIMMGTCSAVPNCVPYSAGMTLEPGQSTSISVPLPVSPAPEH